MGTSNRTVRAFLQGVATLAVALPAIAGCGTGAGSEAVDARGDAINPVYGVDYAWARPSLSHLRSEGYAFAARYLSYDTSGKSITASEAHAIEAAGMDVVVVWEQGGTDALDGYARGVQHATAAPTLQSARPRACRRGRPIYFGVRLRRAQPYQEGPIEARTSTTASPR